MSLRTPVDVSAWTTAITFGLRMRGRERLGIDRLAPLGLDPHDLGAAPRRDVAHALAEHAVHADDDDVAGLDDVDERRLHAGRPGAADRQRQRVGRCGTPCRSRSHVSSSSVEELGVEVAEHRPRQRLDDLGIRVARPRPHEDAIDDGLGHRGMLPMDVDMGRSDCSPAQRAQRTV